MCNQCGSSRRNVRPTRWPCRATAKRGIHPVNPAWEPGFLSRPAPPSDKTGSWPACNDAPEQRGSLTRRRGRFDRSGRRRRSIPTDGAPPSPRWTLGASRRRCGERTCCNPRRARASRSRRRSPVSRSCRAWAHRVVPAAAGHWRAAQAYRILGSCDQARGDLASTDLPGRVRNGIPGSGRRCASGVSPEMSGRGTRRLMGRLGRARGTGSDPGPWS